MQPRTTKSHKQRQAGAIFLALVLILLVTGSTLVLSALNNRQAYVAQQQSEIRREMESAKQALLAYASSVGSNFGDGPGHLPCPDRDNTGVPLPDCDPSTEYFGRLPQHVDIPNPSGNPQRFLISSAYAGTDQQFWYAVSPSYLHTDVGSLQANSTTVGALSVDALNDIVAVIIAPGEELGQDRAAGSNDHAQYLEGGNGVNYQFVSSYAANPQSFNDIVLPITRAELWSVAITEVVKAVKVRLDSYRTTTCSMYPRSWYNPSSCAFSFGHTNALTNFRTVMNNTGALPPAPTWIMSTSGSITGEQDWMGAVSTYSGSTNSATLSFNGCNNLSFTLSYTANTITRSGTDC